MKLLTSLLLTAMLTVASAQSFTNIVNQQVKSHKVFTFNYDDGPGNVNITHPLKFFVVFSEGSSSEIEGELSHQGISYSLFKNIPSSSPISVSPINEFFGKNQGGNWSFSFDTESPMKVYSWGITPSTIIPEPSTFSLALVGGLMVLCGRNNKK